MMVYVVQTKDEDGQVLAVFDRRENAESWCRQQTPDGYMAPRWDEFFVVLEMEVRHAVSRST